jgi:tRNA (adenine37-N6)-methyltransferase
MKPITPIAYVESPFKQKFGLPRQPGLIDAAEAYLRFVHPFDTPQAFLGIEKFSHIWLQFEFHENKRDAFQPMVRPPRLGGNTKIGVFASRSSFRPNALGLSVVRLKEVVTDQGKTSLRISCPDLLDGTPILDIKPYIPYSDSIPNATASYADTAPKKTLKVEFSAEAIASLERQLKKDEATRLERLITEVIELDPRPAYKAATHDVKDYYIRLYDWDIGWRVAGEQATIASVKKL